MPHGSRGVWISQAISMHLPVIVDVLGLRRNIVVLSLAIFCVWLDEELWAQFLPTYLEALGASVLAIGAFGTLQDLLEGLYPYPGGHTASKFPLPLWGMQPVRWRAGSLSDSTHPLEYNKHPIFSLSRWHWGGGIGAARRFRPTEAYVRRPHAVAR
jgi:hypothetical protein